MTNPALIATGLLGLLLFGAKKSSAAVDPRWSLPTPSVPGPAAPPPPAKSTPGTPPIEYAPNGRHLSAEEKAILAPFIPHVDLESVVLWWSTPSSSFASEDRSLYVIAVTTPKGIYLRDPNHRVTSTFDYVTLAHELVHWGQYRTGLLPGPDTPEIELPAYQMGLAVEKHLEEVKARAA